MKKFTLSELLVLLSYWETQDKKGNKDAKAKIAEIELKIKSAKI
jgi:hypothetical protein